MSYSASFGGVGFEIEVEPFGDEVKAFYAEQHAPTSTGVGQTYIDYAGSGARHKRVKCFFDVAANYTSLRGLVGTVGTLVDVVDGTQTNVFLASLGRARVYQGSFQVSADAEFVLTS